jgi:hypothetical protein
MEEHSITFILFLLFIPFSLFLFVVRWNKIEGINKINNSYNKLFYDLGCSLLKEKELAFISDNKKPENSFKRTNLGSPYSLFHD